MKKMTTDSKDAGTVAAKHATHVIDAQQMERSATSARKLVISLKYAAPRRVKSNLKSDASHLDPIFQLTLQALKKLISSKQEFNQVEVRKKF